MGMDIHMHIVKNDEVIAKNIFDGRNSEWFNNLKGDGNDDEYDHFPSYGGIPDNCPEFIKTIYDGDCNNDEEYFGYFGFYYVNAGDYIKWFEKYRPDTDAGWVTTYEKWAWEKKGIKPEYLAKYLNKDANINDMHFIEVVNPWDCGRWLYNYIKDHKIPDDACVIYYFDW